MPVMRRFLAYFLPFLAVIALPAQSVHWSPAGGSIAAGQVGQLSLVFEQCEPNGNVTLPTVANLEFGPASRGENTAISIVNGQMTNSRTVTLAYQIRPRNSQPVEIPAFDVETKQGRLHVAAARFTIGTATVTNNSGGGSLSLDSVAQARFIVPADAVWAGEVFTLTYQLNVSKNYIYNLGSNVPDWNSAPLSIEDWGKFVQTDGVQAGDPRLLLTYQTHASAKLPGVVTLNPATQLVNLQTGVTSFSIFSQRQLEQFTVTTPSASLSVKPLPTPAPAEFAGAVGQFTLDASVVPATVAVGEPVTWTLTFSGAGNWPDISALPPRNVSRDFHVVSPQAKRTPKDNALFDAALSEDVVLIPTKPGTYTLGPVSLACFNPKTGSYQTLTTKPFILTVTAAPGLSASPLSFNPPDAANSSSSPATLATPAVPAGLPRDPLPPAAMAARPVSGGAFNLRLIAAGIWLLPLWLAFAARHAWLTDPRRAQRAARERILTTLGALNASLDHGQTAAQLHRWRRDIATLFGVVRSEPTAAEVFQTADPKTAPDWSLLWMEADRALFGDRQPLPADWPARAEAALATKRVPSFQPLHLFFLRNLFPQDARAKVSQTELPVTVPVSARTAAVTVTAMLLLFALFSQGPAVFAADAAAAYRAANFPAAEKAWRETLVAAPTDWTAHHNLSLALAQQSRWSESAAHALAAFVQQPQNPAVRWQLDVALKNAGWMPDGVAPFLAPDPAHSLAQLAAPSQWQRYALLAALLAAGALALLLWCAYGARSRWIRPAAWTALLSGGLLGAAAFVSLWLYGPLTDPRAVLVWQRGVLRSIPTEADTTQKTVPLAAGQVANTGKTYLGWRNLVFPNGQTGWVRQEEFVSLW